MSTFDWQLILGHGGGSQKDWSLFNAEISLSHNHWWFEISFCIFGVTQQKVPVLPDSDLIEKKRNLSYDGNIIH